jgi:hypothetical protein
VVLSKRTLGTDHGVIELAPRNINGLALRSSVLLAPNCGAALRWADGDLIGAVATDVAVIRAPRSGSARWGAAPAGVVFERLPQTPVDVLLRSERKRWARSPVSVLLTLRGTPDELVEMVERLESVEGIAGLVLLAAWQTTVDAVAAVRGVTTLPVLPVLGHSAQLADDAVAAVAAGADALVLCSYPLGATQVGEELISGLLVGPALLPWTLRALQQAQRAVDVPLIAWGGIADAGAARACLAAGAEAVMVDGALYGDPFAARRIAGSIANT